MSVYRLIVFSLKSSRNFPVHFIVNIDLDRSLEVPGENECQWANFGIRDFKKWNCAHYIDVLNTTESGCGNRLEAFRLQ